MKLVIPIVVILLLAGGGYAATKYLKGSAQVANPALKANPSTAFAEPESPHVSETTYLHPQSCVIGHVGLGEYVFVGPFASIRGDEGVPIQIGDRSNIQDGVVIHGRMTSRKGESVEGNVVTVRHEDYSVYIGKEVSLEHQSQVHGPASIGEGTLVGMQALVADAHVGKHCVIGPRALVIGVEIRDGRLVAPGQVVSRQDVADALPRINAEQRKLSEDVVDTYVQLGTGYRTDGKGESKEGKGGKEGKEGKDAKEGKGEKKSGH